MKFSIAIAALTALASANGQANTNISNLCIASWRFQDKNVWNSVLIPAFEAKHPSIKVTFAPSTSSFAFPPCMQMLFLDSFLYPSLR
jgi:raffinose/stachyose/melibiose transport system substrate-binding protein